MAFGSSFGQGRYDPTPVVYRTCKGVTRLGQPCTARSKKNGFCPKHQAQVK